jgi:hypothetical protein
LGYVSSGFSGMRPWTRAEFARLLEEAGKRIDEDERLSSEALGLYRALVQEFRSADEHELHWQIESVYRF